MRISDWSSDVCSSDLTVSHDWATFSSEAGATFIPTQDEEAMLQLRLTILNMDPPKHNRYRPLVSAGFTPRMIAQPVEEIERRAAAGVDGPCQKGEVEVVEEHAAQVPGQMICAVSGLAADIVPAMLENAPQLLVS